MRIPLLSRSRRGGSYQTNKRAAPPNVRNRDVAASGHDAGGVKSTTTTVSSATSNGEQHVGGVSQGGQNQTRSIVSSKCTSTNSSIHEVYFLLGDEDSVADVAERVKASCSATVSPAVAVNYNYTSGSEIEISSDSWEIIQWYRGSSFALALEGYNSTDTPMPALDSPFFTCLNNTISNNLPVLPHPLILKSHSGWHPNPQSSKGGEIGVIIILCLVSVALAPIIVPTALFLLGLVLLGIVAVVFWCLELVVTVVCWCLEMCCTCCGLVSCVDSDGTVTVETPKPPVATRMPTPTKRMSAMAMDPEKGRYAGNSLRFPPDAVIAHTHRGAMTDWDTFRLLTGSHYHYDDLIMARAYHTSQISSSSNNDNIQIMPPKRLTLSEAKSVLETRTSTTATLRGTEVESEGDKNPIVDSDSDSDSVADSITHLLVSRVES